MFHINFTTDNAAFEGEDYTWEAIRILEEIEDNLQHGNRDGIIFDANGNYIGKWSAH